MATTAAIPVEEYLATFYRPDMEYVDGRLVERHVGEYFHSLLQAMIDALLMGRERERRFRVFTELRVEVRQRRRYRIPDICVKALPHQVTPILLKPDLAIEVLSPDDEPAETLAKVSDYLGSGTPEIWIVDPYKRKLFVADLSGIREVPDLVVANELVGSVGFRRTVPAARGTRRLKHRWQDHRLGLLRERNRRSSSIAP
jgi:Uma2 family endonuclease